MEPQSNMMPGMIPDKPMTGDTGHSKIWSAVLMLLGVLFFCIGVGIAYQNFFGMSQDGVTREQKQEWEEAKQKMSALEEANARAEAERAAMNAKESAVTETPEETVAE